MSLLKKGADVDCIEEILAVVMSQEDSLTRKFNESKMNQSNEKVEEAEEATTALQEDTAEVATSPKKKEQHPLVSWLKDITKLDKFELMMRFANKDLLASISLFLEQNCSSTSLKEKYGVTSSSV